MKSYLVAAMSAAIGIVFLTASDAFPQTQTAPASAEAREPASAQATQPATATAPTATAPASPFKAVYTPASAPSAEDILMARSLTHSARGVMFTPGAPSLGVRLIALIQMANRLNGNDPENLQLLADIQQSMGKDKQAAQTLQHLLSIYPSSWTLSTRWLQYTLKSMELDTASSRLMLLQQLMNDENAPAAFRAEAAHRQAVICQGQAQKNEAMDAVYKALEFDPLHTGALLDKYLNLTSPSPLDKVNLLLNLVRANPRQSKITWDLAATLGAMGLYEHAVAFYNFTLIAFQAKPPDDDRKVQQFYLQQYGAFLDLYRSKRDVQSIAKMAPVVEKISKAFPQNNELRLLLIECCQAGNQNDQAQKVIALMNDSYEDRLKKSILTSDLAAEVAWFHLATLPDAKLAMKYAREAAKINDKSPVVNRILGAAELASDDEAVRAIGEKRLSTLMEMDPYAAVILAEYYDRKGNTQNLSMAINACASAARNGPAFRRLETLLEQIELRDKKPYTLPEVAGAKEVAAAIDSFDPRYLNMLGDASKFTNITIKPVKDIVMPGEPIEVDAVLTNIGSVPLPMGESGLFTPQMQILVKVGKDQNAKVFYSLPMFVWQAPKYIASGQSFSTRIRLDVGPLASYLAARPFENIQIEIDGVLDGEVRGQSLVGAIPSMKINPGLLVRGNLLSMSPKYNAGDESTIVPAYKDILGTITQKSILRGELADRIQAAAQVCSLLAAARQAELHETKLPGPLVSEINKPVILAMLQALLKDKSPAVRAEALAWVTQAPPDQTTIELISLLMDDANPVVRLRVLETLGSIQMRGQERVVTKYVTDRDDIIKALAKGMVP